MARSVLIQLGTEHGDWYKEALRLLAEDVLTDEEAGQRGAKLSKLIQMLATAYISNASETTALMLQIKALTRGGD